MNLLHTHMTHPNTRDTMRAETARVRQDDAAILGGGIHDVQALLHALAQEAEQAERASTNLPDFTA